MVAITKAAAKGDAWDLDDVDAETMEEAWRKVCAAVDMSPSDLAREIAEQSKLWTADLGSVDAHATKLVPGRLAWRRNVLPLRCTDKEIVVATANPLGVTSRRALERASSRSVRFEVAPPGEIAEAVLRAYGPLDEQPSDTNVPDPQTPEMHILVVDDDTQSRNLYRALLEEVGFRVSVARDGPEALELLHGDHSIDLVTLDYWMVKMNGLLVLQEVRAHHATAKIPIIVVTGASDRKIEMTLFEAGADDFLTKPVHGPLLVHRIRAVLRRHGHD